MRRCICLQDGYTLRKLFVVTGLLVFAFSTKNVYIYYHLGGDNPEYARLTKQAIACLIFACIHLVAGSFSFTWTVDYSTYKPMAAFVLWSVWMFFWVAMQLGDILAYEKVAASVYLSIVMALMFLFLILWQLVLYYRKYTDHKGENKTC